MVRRESEQQQITKKSPFEGNGEITVRNILESPEEMYGKGRVFCHTTIFPDSGIGYHVHDKESETYYILSGRGIFNDNGKLVEVGEGDMLFTGDKQGHALEAAYGEKIELIALILYR